MSVIEVSMRVATRLAAGVGGAAVGAALTMLIRWALGMPYWMPGPVLVVATLSGILAYLAVALGTRVLFSLGIIRGSWWGLLGVSVTIGVVMLVRLALGLAAWEEAPVLVPAIFVGVVTYLATLGVFQYWRSRKKVAT